MAVRFNNKVSYVGAVLNIRSHYWLDGMEEVNAIVWDLETHETKSIQIGYYGIDGTNLAGGTAEIDVTNDVKRDIYRTLKVDAYKAFEKSVVEFKNKISKDSNVEVVKGRKIKKGTKLNVFWVGERETFKSRQYSWMHETEEIAGCYDEDGNKVWIKTEYLRNLDPIKSPNSKERKKFIKNYIVNRMKEMIA